MSTIYVINITIAIFKTEHLLIQNILLLLVFNININIYAHIHTYRHMYIWTFIHTHTHIYIKLEFLETLAMLSTLEKITLVYCIELALYKNW
jgi:hypothetical protein